MDKDNQQPIDLGLLRDFPLPSEGEWKKAVEDTLKGVPFEKAMFTKTYEGIDLKPIYTSADVQGLPHLESLPGATPFLRGNSAAGYTLSGWKIAQQQSEIDPAKANRIILDELNRGLTAINLRLNPATSSGLNPSPEVCTESGLVLSVLDDLTTLLEGVDLSAVPLLIQSKEASLLILGLVNAYLKKQDLPLSQLNGCIGFDPLAEMACEGELVISMDAAWQTLYQSTYWADLKARNLRTILLDGTIWGNAGASSVQELAYVMASAVHYIEKLMEMGLSIEQIAPRFQLNLTLGSNFFMEIAKVRAARLLWAELTQAYGASEEHRKIWIHGVTSEFNKTIFDPYVNMLRTTTEGFSGVIGGVDSLEILPFDLKIREADEFSRRIARNQQIILQEEAHFDRVIDPAGGCYYVEALTAEIAEKTWEKFQLIQKTGGMLHCITEQIIQSGVSKTALERMTNVDKRKDIFVGINMYANTLEKPLEKSEHLCTCAQGHQLPPSTNLNEQELQHLKKSLKFIADDPNNDFMVDMLTDAWLHGANIEDVFFALYPDDPDLEVENVYKVRATIALENLRSDLIDYQQEHETVLSVFMANMGPITQHKARADFATGFLQVGGFYIAGNDGFGDVPTAVEAAIFSQAQMCCLCSTDDTYPELVPAFVSQIRAVKPEMIIILAGYPSDMVETYKAQGIDFFIHLKANVFEVINDIAKKLGVKQ